MAAAWVIVSPVFVPVPSAAACPTFSGAGIVLLIQGFLALVSLATTVAVGFRAKESTGMIVGWVLPQIVVFWFCAGWEYWEYGGACRLSF